LEILNAKSEIIGRKRFALSDYYQYKYTVGNLKTRAIIDLSRGFLVMIAYASYDTASP